MCTTSSNPSYYGILTASVRYNKNLGFPEKVLYTELTALTQKEGYCWASNKYFAELYGVTTRSISKWFGNLSQEGFIYMEVEDNYSRKIWLTETGGMERHLAGGGTDIRTGDGTKLLYNNTSNNTNNSIESKYPKRQKPKDLQEVEDYLKHRGIRTINANMFFSHYEASGWIRGKTPIKDWRKCVDTWIERDKKDKRLRGEQV